MRERVANSVFWIVWSRGILQLLSFLSTLVVARLLAPGDYGLAALAAMWTSTMAVVSELGLGAVIVQFRDLDERELNLCFWLSASVSGVGYFSLYAAAPAIAQWFTDPGLANVLRVAALILPLMTLRIVPESLLRKGLELDKVSRAEIVSTAVTIPIVLGLAWSGAGVWTLVAGAIVKALVQSAVSLRFARWWPGLRIGSTRPREMLRFGLAALGAHVGWAVYQEIGTFVLGKMSGNVAVGFYSMARQIANLPVERVSAVVNQLALPLMAELQTDPRNMRTSFLRIVRLTGCLTVPLCVGIGLVADDFVRAVLGEKWLPASVLLQALSVFALVRSIGALLPGVLLARNRVGFLFWSVGGLLPTMSVAAWLGAASLGALGVALANVAVYSVFMLWIARASLKELELRWQVVAEQVAPIAVATVAMSVAVLAVFVMLPASSGVEHLVRLGLGSAVGGLVYAGGVYWHRGPVVRDLAEVVVSLFRRMPQITTMR